MERAIKAGCGSTIFPGAGTAHAVPWRPHKSGYFKLGKRELVFREGSGLSSLAFAPNGFSLLLQMCWLATQVEVRDRLSVNPFPLIINDPPKKKRKETSRPATHFFYY